MASTAIQIIQVSVFVDGPGLATAVVAAVRADTVRRLRLVAVRTLRQTDRLECVMRAALRGPRLRVLSFGIRHLGSFAVLSAFSFQVLQGSHSWIVPVAPAGARTTIQIRAADRAQSAAILAAQRLHRQRQVELLPHQLTEIDLVVLVERRREIVFLDFPFALTSIRRMRLVAEIELRVHAVPERLETA